MWRECNDKALKMGNIAREMWAANVDAFFKIYLLYWEEMFIYMLICKLFQRGKAIEPILKVFPCNPDLAKVTALGFLGTSCGLTF